MARVQSQQIIEALDQMRGLNGQTDSLLDIIQAQQEVNADAIREMGTAADLLRRLMQGRQDMEDIMNAVGRHGQDMSDNVERIRDALNGQPTVQQMQAAVQNLEDASSQALQAGLPAAPAQANNGLNPGAQPFQPRPGNGEPIGGYNWRSSAKKSKSKTRRRRGGYNWRSTQKKTKTKTREKMKTHTKPRTGRKSSASRVKTRK